MIDDAYLSTGQKMILNVVIADWTIARLNFRLTKTERRSHDNLIGITSGFSRSGSDCHQPLSAASRARPAS